MNHWIILPILIPAVVAPLLAMSVRHDILLARVFSVGSTVLLLILGMVSVAVANEGETFVYSLGSWPAPFGIVLVLDRLSATMLMLTAALGLCVLLYAISGCDRRGQHFHPLFQFQLMGLNGAFLTGDLFNLFVFFEVLLIASYGLMVHGGGAARLRAGIQYVVINLVGSSIFLIALGSIYGVTGTLNLADFAVKLQSVTQRDQAILMTGATLLVVVFGIKSALFPLQFWLPGTYTNTSGAVAALFAIMTKVGVYAIVRVHSIALHQTAEFSISVFDWMMPAAAVTLAVGMIGVFAARSLGQQASFAALGSVGTLLIAVCTFTPQSLSAGLFYMWHSTFAIAALFMIVDLVIIRRSSVGDALTDAPRFDQIGLLGSLFFLTVIAILGMPPLSGFIGKLLILDSIRQMPMWTSLWTLILATSLIALIGFARSGSLVFWKSMAIDGRLLAPKGIANVLPIVAIGSVLGLLVLLTGFAGLVTVYLDGIADQVHSPQAYVDAVLNPP